MLHKALDHRFLDFCDTCAADPDINDVFDALVSSLSEFGIVRHHYIQMYFDAGGELDVIAMNSSFERAFLDGFLAEGMHKHDILVDFCKARTGIALWSEQSTLADLGDLTAMQERTVRYVLDHRLNAGVLLSLPHFIPRSGVAATGMSLIPEPGTHPTEFDPLIRENRQLISAIGEVLADSIDPVALAVQCYDLSEVERRVLSFLAKGYQMQQVADALMLSDRMAANYTQRVRAKLGARSSAQAVARAMRIGIL